MQLAHNCQLTEGLYSARSPVSHRFFSTTKAGHQSQGTWIVYETESRVIPFAVAMLFALQIIY